MVVDNINIIDLEKNWAKRGFSFGIGIIKANDGVNKSMHIDKDEMVLMENGEYEFTIDDEKFSQNGEVEVYIPAGVTHSIKNIGAKDSKIYYGYKSTEIK